MTNRPYKEGDEYTILGITLLFPFEPHKTTVENWLLANRHMDGVEGYTVAQLVWVNHIRPILENEIGSTSDYAEYDEITICFY